MDPDLFAQRRVGTTLRGKWRLEKLLGVGGMAAVYVGVHTIGRRQAIKILHPEIARSRELRARFEQEARAVNRLKHTGAVEIRDIDVTEDGEPFLVMELLEGESLAERAARLGGIEAGELLRLSDELLDVLAAAHAQGIIHRDIKLDNLFVLTDGRLKVLDFGIARVRDGVQSDLRTRTGAALGTVPYMAPEQVMGVDVDARVDLFAVGATMFRLVARRHVHEAETEAMVLIKMATEPAPKLASVAPGAPPRLCLVVDRALRFQREQRYPDAITMQRDVQALRAGMDPPYAAALASGGGATLGDARTVASPAVAHAALHALHAASAVTAAPPAPFAAGTSPSPRTREDEKLLAVVIVTLAAMLLLVVVVALVRRGGGSAETSASAAPTSASAAPTSDPPSAVGPGDPSWPSPAATGAKPGRGPKHHKKNKHKHKHKHGGEDDD